MGVGGGEHELPFNPAGKGTGEGRQEEAEAGETGSLVSTYNFLSAKVPLRQHQICLDPLLSRPKMFIPRPHSLAERGAGSKGA